MKPNVLCVGFAKCGTTTLYDIMKQHPDIYVSKIKEPIYYGSQDLMDNKGFQWYQKRYYPRICIEKVIMEINPILGRNVKASQIQKDFGAETKIIFFIRNPAERMYSEFKMNLIDGTCFPNLEENLGENTQVLFDQWIKNSFFQKDGQYELKQDYSTAFCESGNYYPKIKDYLNVFGKDQVRVFLFEEFIKNPQEICSQIFDFIEVSKEEKMNYQLHSNEGNRLPKSIRTMRLNQIWFLKIYKQFLIEKLPFISDKVCEYLNDITWKVPILLSKPNEQNIKMSDESRRIIETYYEEMTNELSELLKMDLKEKWGYQRVLRK